ncbi:MAG: Rpn family recombination-promoting nuclease/putative transposase, partial [Clostridiales bacterium]|nr:Rpn family recombination-promoting nuclease/putative transposase [Clostridiales bacterium]
MGAQDTSTRDYVNEADIFSDAYNYLMYDGEPELEAGMLRPLDTSLYMKIFGSSDFKNDIEKAQDTIRKSEKTNSRKKRQKSVKRDPYESVQRYRDAVRLASAKTDGHFTYIILGLEAQTHVHYAMCIRNLIYDGLQYARQVEELRLKHRLAGDTDIPDEFLSGMKKNDRLLPVITLVIHFAPEPWDGALSLKELLDIPDERIQPFIQDYKVFLIDPARMDDDEFKKFSTNLGDALKFMKYSANDIKMEELIKGDAFKKLDRKAAQVIKDCANIDIEIKPNQEVINMCKAWDDHAKKVAAQAVKEANQKNEEHNKKLCKAWEDHA